MEYSVLKSFVKIRKCIDSSKNKLHLNTCIAMIALFNLHHDDEISTEQKSDMELTLKNKLDERAVELGLLII